MAEPAWPSWRCLARRVRMEPHDVTSDHGGTRPLVRRPRWPLVMADGGDSTRPAAPAASIRTSSIGTTPESRPEHRSAGPSRGHQGGPRSPWPWQRRRRPWPGPCRRADRPRPPRPHRSASRMTNFSPDQVSSIAHTLTSTRPLARPNSRTTPSPRSVTIPDDRLGQHTQIIPAVVCRAAAASNRRSNVARSGQKSSTTSYGSRPGRRWQGAPGSNPAGAPSTRTREPARIPSLRGSGVPE